MGNINKWISFHTLNVVFFLNFISTGLNFVQLLTRCSQFLKHRALYKNALYPLYKCIIHLKETFYNNQPSSSLISCRERKKTRSNKIIDLISTSIKRKKKEWNESYKFYIACIVRFCLLDSKYMQFLFGSSFKSTPICSFSGKPKVKLTVFTL